MIVDINKNDDKLYYYTSAEVAIKHILYEKKIMLNPLYKMRDPYENKNFNFDYEKLNPEQSPEIFQKVEKIQIAIKRHCKIVCFCSNKKPLIYHIQPTPQPNKTDWSVESQEYKFDVKGLYHSRMWDQYADRHQGVCIIFSKQKLLKALNQQYSSNQKFTDYIGYTKQHLYIQQGLKLNCDELLNSTSDSFIKEYLNKQKRIRLFTKNIDYINEAEYRLVLYDGSDDESKYLEISDCIIGVITGEKCHNSLGSYMSYLCKELSIFCKPIEWINGKPDVW